MTAYLPKGSTVTGAYYADELRKLCEELKSVEESCNMEFICCMVMCLPTPQLLRRLLWLNVAMNHYFIHHIRQI